MFGSEAHAEELEKEASSRVSTMALQVNKALQRVQIETNHTKGFHPIAPGKFQETETVEKSVYSTCFACKQGPEVYKDAIDIRKVLT
jgi:hypothetical protein